MKTELKEAIYYFGYANVEGNPTAFFDYEEHSEADLANFEKFRADSRAALD